MSVRGFFEKLRQDFDLFNSFAIQNQDHELAPLLFKEVYNNQLFSKALLLNHINRQKDKILESGNVQLIQLLSEWENEKEHLSSLYYQKKPKPTQIEQAESKIQQLEQDINSRSDFLKDLQDEVSWQEVRDRLVKDEAAVEIIRIRAFNLRSELSEVGNFQFTNEYSYLVLILSVGARGPDFFVIPDGNNKEGKNLNLYRNSILHKIEDVQSYGNYWKPLGSQLSNRSSVYLSANGVYSQINLNSLKNPATGNYVLDETNLVFVTNTKDLVLSPSEIVSKKAALFGRPQYLVGNNIEQNHQLTSSELRSLDSKVFDGFRE
ncbi:MAG: hypothetical protein GY816_09120 [Cytophagales bacterium]|nr:hypothetical protein [Cytophagales bacterium]